MVLPLVTVSNKLNINVGVPDNTAINLPQQVIYNYHNFYTELNYRTPKYYEVENRVLKTNSSKWNYSSNYNIKNITFQIENNNKVLPTKISNTKIQVNAVNNIPNFNENIAEYYLNASINVSSNLNVFSIYDTSEIFFPANSNKWFLNNSSVTSGYSTIVANAAKSVIKDYSTNNFSMTVSGNTTLTKETPFAIADGYWAGFFDGSGDYLTFPSISISGDFTVEMWVNPTAYPNPYHQILSNGIQWYIYNGGILNVHGILAHQTLIELNTWTHVAFVRSNGVATLYVNGVKSNTTANWSSTFSVSYIGTWGSGNEFFCGYISNYRITSNAVYTDDFTPPTSPLTAIAGTTLLTLQSNRFYDKSSNNYLITSVNDVKAVALNPFNYTETYDPETKGASAYFDGSGDWITTPNVSAFNLSDSNTEFTIEGWVYRQGSSYNGIIGARGNGVTHGWCIYIHTNGTLHTGSTIVGNAYTDRQLNTTLVPLGSWTHIAVVKTATGYKGYVNGVGGPEVALTGGFDYQSAQQIIVGALGSGGEYPFVGKLSDIRLIKGTALYTSDFTPPTAPLTPVTNTQLLLNFKEISDSLTDITGKNAISIFGNGTISSTIKKYSTGSVYFGGPSTDYLYSPSSAEFHFGSNDFTIEAWLYFTDSTINAVRCVFSNYTSFASGGSIFFGKHSSANAGCMSVYLSNYSGSPLLAETTYPPSNTWVHYAFVRYGNTYRLFRNGKITASATWTGNPTNGTCPVFIGAAGDAINSYNFTGYMNDFRIVRGTAIYTDEFTPPESDLTVVSGTSLLTCQYPIINFDTDEVNTNLKVLKKYTNNAGGYVLDATNFSTLSSSHTISVWYRVQKWNSNQVLFSNEDLCIYSEGASTLSLTDDGTTTNSFGSYGLTNNSWKLYTFTFDGSDAKLYVDGSYVSTAPTYKSFAGKYVKDFVLGQGIIIGDSLTRYANFSVWDNIVLTDQQITTLYNNGNPDNALVANTEFVDVLNNNSNYTLTTSYTRENITSDISSTKIYVAKDTTLSPSVAGNQFNIFVSNKIKPRVESNVNSLKTITEKSFYEFSSKLSETKTYDFYIKDTSNTMGYFKTETGYEYIEQITNENDPRLKGTIIQTVEGEGGGGTGPVQTWS